jgi:hypothetical protein
MTESNCGHLIGEEGISSAAGIISSIDAHPAKLFQLDEIQNLIRAIGSPKMTHLASIPATLSQMYSAVESQWKPNAYADRTKNMTIDQPHAVLHSTSSLTYQTRTSR